MGTDKIDQLYDDLKSLGIVSKDRENFRKKMLAPGREGFENRYFIWKTLHDNGLSSHDSFAKNGLGLHPTSQPTAKAAPARKATGTATGQWKMPANFVENAMQSPQYNPGANNPRNTYGTRKKMQPQQPKIHAPGYETNEEKKRQERVMRLRRDQLDYIQATGKPLENPLELGVQHDENGNVVTAPPYAPSLQRDKNGNIATGENGEPLIGMDTDNDAREAYRISSQAKVEADRSREELKRQLEEAYKTRDELDEKLRARRRELEDSPWWQKMLAEMGKAAHSGIDPNATANDPEHMGYENDEEYMQLMSAARKNHQTIQTLEDKRDGKMDNFWHALNTTATNGYTFNDGLPEMRDVTALNNAKKHIDAINRKRQKGLPLTREEQVAEAVLKANENDDTVQSQYGADYGKWSRDGAMTINSIDYMKDFLLMPGGEGMAKAIAGKIASVGGKVLAKEAGESVLKAVPKAIARATLKATGVLVGAHTAGSVISNITGMGRTAALMGQTSAGNVTKDEKGNYKIENEEGLMHALASAERTQMRENGSEMAGAFLPGGKFLGGLFKKGLEKIGLSKVSNFLTQMGNKEWYKRYSQFLKTGGYNGIPGEAFEEYEGELFDALTGHADEAWKDFTDAKQNTDIWLGCATMGALMGAIPMGIHMGGYYKYRHDMNKADKVAAFRMTQAKWEPLKEELDNTDNGNMADVVTKRIVMNNDLNQQEKVAALNYVRGLTNFRGFNIAQASNAGDEEDQKSQGQNEAYRTGYNAVDGALTDGQQTDGQTAATPSELDIKVAYAQARDGVAGMYGEDFVRQLDDDPDAALAKLEDESLGRQKAQAYVDAKAMYEGMIQRARDDMDDRVQTVENEVDSHVNPVDQGGDGMIHPATLKEKNDDGTDRKVYIVSGNVQMTADGTMVDKEKSSPSIVIRDPQTGETKMLSPADILSVDEPIDPEQERREAADAARQEFAAQRADRIDGLTPMSNPGQNDDVWVKNENGEPVHGVVTQVDPVTGEYFVQTDTAVNGKMAQPFQAGQLYEMATPAGAAAKQQPAEQTDGSLKEEQPTRIPDRVNGAQTQEKAPQEQQTQEEAPQEQPQRAIDRIPGQDVDDGKGNVRTVHNWEQADPGDTYDALTEIYHGNADRVKKGVQIRINAIDNQMKATQKQMDAIDNSDDFDAVAAQGEKYDQLQQQKNALEQQKKYWQGVQNVPASRRAVQDRRTEAEKAAAKAEREKAEQEAIERARQERERVNGVPDVANDAPSDARKRGFRNVYGMVVNRQGNTEGVTGRESSVKFSSKDTAKGKVKVIEANSLQPSHVNGQRNPQFFIDEAQPKDRTDTVSSMAAAKIASSLNPEEITGDGSAYQFSAPTVNSRGEVIQGNNRSDALKLMYSTPAFKPAQDAYKQYIIDHASDFGFTPEDVERIKQMKRPVMVNELDVDDDEAIRLGQMKASDNESGGIERIDPVTTSQKLGSKVRNYANILLSSPDEDASLSDVLMQNGSKTVHWLSSNGVISDTAAQSAFDRKGNLTPEARMDLLNVLKQSLFQGGVSDLRTMFGRMPAKAQKAILNTFMRDFDSAESERVLPEIQKSIEAWYGCANASEAFAKAPNYKAAKAAMHDWTLQTNMLDDNMPSDRFSNFAMELACRLQGCSMRETQQSLNDFFDLVQGKSQGDLFGGTTMGEQTDRQEAIKRIFNIEYNPINNKNNGKNGSNAMADDNSQGGEGRHGSPGDGAERERAAGAGQHADVAGGTEGNDEGTQQTGVRLNKEEAERLLSNMESQAEASEEVELTPAAWSKTFDENNSTDTPIGRVKMGEGQITKFFAKGREKEFGMVGPTLNNPDVIIEEKSEAKNGKAERKSSYVFVKTFNRNGEKIKFYASITVKQDGMEVSVSSHYMNRNAVLSKMQEGNVFYIRKALLPNSSDWHLAEHRDGVPDLLPTQGSTASSAAKLGNSSESGDKKSEKVGEGSNNSVKEDTAQHRPTERSNDSAHSIGATDSPGKVAAERQNVNTEPTEGQKEAGNYKKGHIKVDGYDITIENPKGSTRSGKDASGKAWTVPMHYDYGYIKGTEGVDGDHIDVYLSDDPTKGNVYVVDQVNQNDGSFDEHKVMYGFPSMEAAVEAYKGQYEDGWKVGTVTEVSRGDFKKWVESSRRKTKPFADYKSMETAAQQQRTEPSGKQKTEEKPKAKRTPDTKIEDVGDHLKGARKDMLREIAKSLANITEAELVEKPFGKVYKKPDLKKAVESGALREKDAIFYEALFSMMNQQKPKVTQSEMRSKRYIPDYKTKAERWAADTFKQMEVLRQFMELDEPGRDAMMERMLADRYPTREQELAEIEKRKGWNPDYEGHKYEWGDKTTPNPLWVTHEVMNRMGYNVGDKLDIPFGVVEANTSGTGYSIKNLKGERAWLFGSDMTLDEAIDRIVYLAKLKRGDADVSHPTQLFAFPATNGESGESGRYRVMWGRDYKTRDFDSKEDADAFAQTKSGAYVSPIMETKRRFGYKVRFTHPLTGEKMFVDDAEFDTKEEAQAYFDSNFEKINDATNAKLQEEREKKGEKKTLKADDVVHVTMVHSGKGGWTHAVVIDKKYANNDGQVRIIKEGFASRKDAQAFADSVKDDVLKTVLKHKEEAKKIVYFDTGENSRIGEDYRNGKNVDAEDFMNTFGFRGVQFGNWTNQEDRQMALNQAYDALMDLANVIGVSPQAISLNGELGIAFGSRGSGNANAHYEPNNVVINLTKTRGAGSLAHEWWHALDNYFARRVGRPLGMVTDNREIAMRAELREAFNNMLDLVEKSDYARRSRARGEYWGSMHEITARLLSEWIDNELKKRSELNTFLTRGANVERWQRYNYKAFEAIERIAGREPISFEEFKERPESLSGFPYPSTKEVEQFGASLRHIFDTIEERVDEKTGMLALLSKVIGEAKPVSEDEAALRDAVMNLEREAGLDVIDDVEEGQRVLDMANDALLNKNKKRALETASPNLNGTDHQTVVSSTLGAKVLKDLDNLVNEYEFNKGNKPNTFIGDLSRALGAQKHGSNSEYATFETKNGRVVTIRLANHNAKVSTFDNHNETDGISIVITANSNAKLTNDGNAHVTEFYYNALKLRRAEGKPLADIVRSIKQALYSGEFKDTTGLAERQEVNIPAKVRKMMVYHGSAADFDAFDTMNHLSEGEGNQAFGAGTYVADQKDLGMQYANIAYDNDHIKQIAHLNGERLITRFPTVEDFLNNPKTQEAMAKNGKTEAELRAYYDKQQKNAEAPRILYTVEIPDDNGYNYLDWDGGLTRKQADTIRKKLYDAVLARDDDYKGAEKYLAQDLSVIKDGRHIGDSYGTISDYLGSDKAASEFLHDLGYTGIKVHASHNSNDARYKDNLNYVVFNDKDLKIKDKVRFFRTADGEAYGFTADGKIYIDPRIATSETPIHEYAHLWAEALRKANPKEWQNVVELMKECKPVWEQVKKEYPELRTDDEIADEVLARYSGRRGAERARKAMEESMDGNDDLKSAAKKGLARLKEALSKFWKNVCDLLHVHFTSADEVADKVMYDLLNKVKPGDVNRADVSHGREDVDAVNKRFNEELDAYVNQQMPKNDMLHLGMPLGVLGHFLPNLPIVMRQRILTKASVKKHNVDLLALRDMPKMMSHPIFIFQRADNAIGILTEMKDRDGKNVCVAIDLARTIQDGGEMLEVNDIRSIHGREISDIVYPILKNETLRWVDKAKGLAYLSSASRYVQQEIDKQDLSSAAKIVEDFENPVIKDENLSGDEENNSMKGAPTTPAEAEESDVLYREVDDDEQKRLDSEPTVKVYRAMQEHDGKLYPPMSGRVREQYTTKNGTVRNRWVWRSPIALGKWEQSEEHPEMANEDGTFTLDKGNGSTINAAYNPYIHTSRTPINDQFSSAWNRPELVTVEVEVPESELTSGYRAERAKDATGEVEWKSGPVGREMAAQGKPRMVILSRWDKPVRIVPVEEVADEYAKRLQGTGISVPFNTVPPALREALVARGVEISEPEKGNAGQASRPSYEEWMHGRTREREGSGAYSDDELSMINDPFVKMLGEKARTAKQRKAFAARERRRMEAAAHEWADKLHLDNVEIVTSNDRSTRRGRAKGYYDKATGKIVVNINNHQDVQDVVQTILHEAVGHYGLRQLFGQHFNTFLENVYAAADMDVRRRITELALRKYKGDFHVATEEYLASLAEDTNYESLSKGFWPRIKQLFLRMLRAIGLEGFADRGVTLSDNELRYILWRSYKNLSAPGEYRSFADEAEDVAKQAELEVGDFRLDKAIDQGASPEKLAVINEMVQRSWLVKKAMDTLKQLTAAKRELDEAIKENPSSEKASRLRGQLEKLNETMDDNRDWAEGLNVDLRQLLKDNGVKEEDLREFDSRQEGNDAAQLRPTEQSLKEQQEAAEREAREEKVRRLTQRFVRTFKQWLKVKREYDRSFQEDPESERTDTLGDVLNGWNDNMETLVDEAYEMGLDARQLRQKLKDNGTEDEDLREYDGLFADESVGDGVAEADFHNVVDAMYTDPDFDRASHLRDRYDIGRTPEWMKEIGISGDYFSLSFKNIKTHQGKDADHDLTREEWHAIPKAIQHPFLITKYKGASDRFRLYVNMLHNGHFVAVGIDVKRVNQGKNKPMLEVNSIKTLFAKGTERVADEEIPIAVDKNITPEQQALLRGHNFHEYPTIQELSAAKLVNNVESAIKKGENVSEPEAWGKKDLLSKAEQVSHGIEPDLLFRDSIEDDDDTARETYNRMADRARETFREAWQDSMINVRRLQESVLKQRGEKLEDWEDAYNEENRSHGHAQDLDEYFDRTLYKPLLKAVNAVAKAAKVSVGDVTEYMMAKHGLERNEVFARRDAQAAWEKYKERKQGEYNEYQTTHPNGNKTLDDFMDKSYDDFYNHYREKDYSGLTSLTGTDNVQDAEAEAQRIVADMEGRNGIAPYTTKLWKATNEATGWTLQKAYESGVISKDNYEQVSRMFDYYIPLRGWKEDTAGDLYDYVGSGDKGTAFSPTLHKAKGRRSQADNPIAYISSMAVSAIEQGRKNLVKQSFMWFVENHPTNLVTVSEMWYRNYGTEQNPDWREDVPDIPEDATADEIADIVKQHEDDMKQLEAQGMATKERGRLHLGVPVKAGQAKEHHVEVMVNGKKYVLYINGNPRAAQALNGTRARRASEHGVTQTISGIADNFSNMKNLFGKTMAWVLRRLATMQRAMGAFFTSKNPAFMLGNALRDVDMALASTIIDEPIKYAHLFRMNMLRLGGPIGMIRLMHWYNKEGAGMEFTDMKNMKTMQRYFYEFVKGGGRTGFTSLRDIDDYKIELAAKFNDLKRSKVSPVLLFKDLADCFEYCNRAVEDMTRFATFVAARQYGKSVRESVSDAKNITLNFNRKGSGEMGNVQVRDLIIFVNPAIQALDRIVSMARRHPVKFSAYTAYRVLAGMGTPYITMLLWNVFGGNGGGNGGGDGGDDDDKWNAVDEYWKLPTWTRRNNLVFWIPTTKKFAVIPLSQEMRVANGFGEALTSELTGHSNESTMLTLASGLAGLLPIDFEGNGGNPLITIAPTATQPLFQVSFNTDFTGRPIYKDNDFNKYEPSFQKAYIGTPKELISLSAKINELTGGNDHKQGWWERTKVGGELNNPAVVNHLLKGYFGGMYSILAQTGGLLWNAYLGETSDVQEVPVANRVVTAVRETQQNGKTKLPDWYYDLADDSKRYQSEVSGYKRDMLSGKQGARQQFDAMTKTQEFKMQAQIQAIMNNVNQIRAAQPTVEEPQTEEEAQTKQELAEGLQTCLRLLDKIRKEGRPLTDKEMGE